MELKHFITRRFHEKIIIEYPFLGERHSEKFAEFVCDCINSSETKIELAYFPANNDRTDGVEKVMKPIFIRNNLDVESYELKREETHDRIIMADDFVFACGNSFHTLNIITDLCTKAGSYEFYLREDYHHPGFD